MLVDEMRAALAAAPREMLCDLSKALWQAFADGAVSEAEAEALSGLIEARRAVGKSATVAHSGLADRFLGSRKLQRPPVRSVAVERRRRWAAAGRMPPAIAAHFTTGEQAALAVVAVEVVKRQACSMAIGAVAALAGVSESTVKRALRHARALGLLLIKERRLSRFRNDTNVVTVISREWLSWLELRRSGGGVQSRPGANTRGFREGAIGADQPHARAAADSHKRPYGTGRGPIMERSEGFGRSAAGRR